MGRQAYLAKLAFGRSAFEPTHDVTHSDEFIQLEPTQADLPQRYQDFDGNNYVQLYDERGNAINPRAREYGKNLRNAQNDVLAAVGVVERRSPPSLGLPGSYQERLDDLDLEDSIGGVLGTTFTISQSLCTWWIGIIRDRILTFRYHDAEPFTQIVALEHAVSGASIIYTGLVPRLAAKVCTQTVLYYAFVYQPLTRLMHLVHASPRVRKLYRQSKGILKFGLRLALEVFFYPISYHADLQRLGLILAHPYLPPWSALNPLSSTSPLRPFSLYYDPSASLLDCVKAVVTSPVVAVCGEHLLGRWVYSTIDEAVDASIIRPDNPDIVSPEAGDKHRLLTALGLRRRSPPLVRKAIKNLMVVLGWGTSVCLTEADTQTSSRPTEPRSLVEGQDVDVAGTAVTNVAPLDLAVAHGQDQRATESLDMETLPRQATAANEEERPTTPVTPWASVLQHGDDPRIRITRREGIVEMEVRLPPQILSTHTEVADALPSTRTHEDVAYARHDGPQHRVSHLSLLSSDMISGIVKTHLVGIAMLPLRLVVLRLVASQYLTGNGGNADFSRVVVPLPRFRDLSWRSIGIQVSRLALCSVLQLVIDLGLWGVQYVLSVQIGKSLFGWGNLKETGGIWQ